MREEPVDQRVKNFDSVPLGYNEREAIAEAGRCIQCKNPPCEANCPVNVSIREVIRHIADANFREAFFILKRDNPIPSVAGRVCPQEDQCEGKCALGKKGDAVNIGKLCAFVGDWARSNGVAEEYNIIENGKRVAVIGSGPAAISCAVDLRRFGYQVKLFETLHVAGGVLQYGIPAFRLPRDIVDYELSQLDELGIEVSLNNVIGQNIHCTELRKRYDAVFIGTGAGAPLFLGIDGEHLKGVYSANEFLLRVNLMKAYRFPEYDTPIICGDKVGVIGAGNVAMDAARCAIRLGAKEVFILYRRTKDLSPAREEELNHALEEGVIFQELVAPVKIIGNDDGWIKGIELFRMKLEAPDESGRPRPVKIVGSEFIMGLDTLICALGTKPNRLFLDKHPLLKKNRRGGIEVDKNLMTSVRGVFSGGDAISGGATVIQALGEGRKAANSIHALLGAGCRAKGVRAI
jgi:glutamate synthase (NADPH/NADH) small chain